MTPSVMDRAVLTMAAFGTGMLGAASFVWCFLFRSLFASCVLERAVDELFFWGSLCVQVMMLFFCFRKYSKTLSRYLDLICAVNIVALFGCLICLQYKMGFRTYLPILFSLNLIWLSVWLPVTFEAVYLCPPYANAYFQLGFFTATTVHYLLLSFGSVTTSFLFIPFACFLIAGLYSLRVLKKQEEFKSAILDRRAIFITRDNLYVTINFSVIPSFIGMELCVVAVMTVGFAVFMTAAGVYTDVVKVLKTYLLMFQFGTFCVGGMGYPSRKATFVYCMTACILMPLVFVLQDLTIKSVLFLAIFFLFINGVTCETTIMLAKLKKGINGPKIVLSVCLLVNICITLSLNVLYKVYIETLKK
ncbi:envelope protein UL43 [Equid gammaherpesvirus 2]|uniref:Gene 58 protein n=1 Tax=Equine herpesvirus 2 (strain 86/87) TaxID=82831 RepID=VG58_EHV2|nr:envelope protein UL43 [Equid gammaherpesvirus 2]Q66660.1 RecName: Full=Gene 58 protein [Equid herpesvirus type 2 strain 86/87]AAC13846.1 envelope protein UL43 [Equid gammaherpesvirus 2]UTM04287.1 envelope protein UL43 [Equid gammaherpesvirus 2]UTM05540.1 envelope protein UL43 [Equid gammaherpesvirus 2]